jgi:hypothetical protein
MSTLFQVVTPYGLVGRYQHFGETYCLHIQPWRWRQYVYPKRWYLPTSPRCVVSQNNIDTSPPWKLKISPCESLFAEGQQATNGHSDTWAQWVDSYCCMASKGHWKAWLIIGAHKSKRKSHLTGPTPVRRSHSHESINYDLWRTYILQTANFHETRYEIMPILALRWPCKVVRWKHSIYSHVSQIMNGGIARKSVNLLFLFPLHFKKTKTLWCRWKDKHFSTLSGNIVWSCWI